MAHIDMEQIAKLNGQIAMDLKVERDTLRAAAQQALEALEGGDLLCELTAARLLSNALKGTT